MSFPVETAVGQEESFAACGTANGFTFQSFSGGPSPDVNHFSTRGYTSEGQGCAQFRLIVPAANAQRAIFTGRTFGEKELCLLIVNGQPVYDDSSCDGPISYGHGRSHIPIDEELLVDGLNRIVFEFRNGSYVQRPVLAVQDGLFGAGTGQAPSGRLEVSPRGGVVFPAGGHATLDAVYTGEDGPISNATVLFEVTEGPSVGESNRGSCLVPFSIASVFGASHACSTDAEGRQALTYEQSGDDAEVDRLRLWVDENSNGQPDFAEASTTVEVHWRDTQATYVALGDSYSSGEGTPPYEPGTEDEDQCHRSVSHSYSSVMRWPGSDVPVDDDPSVDHTMFACSGAVMANITRVAHGGLPAQLVQLEESGLDPDLVTMSISGNDANFSAVSIACAKTSCLDEAADFTGDLTMEEWLPAHIDSLQSQLVGTLAQVRRAAEDATVLLVGYPRLMTDHTCDLTVAFGGGESFFFNDMTDRLNGVMADAAETGGVHFVNPQPEWTSHELCGDGLRYMRWARFIINTERDFIPDEWIDLSPYRVSRESFHPNYLGQRAYAAAVERTLEDAVEQYGQNAVGLPPNPNDGPLTCPSPPCDDPAPSNALTRVTEKSPLDVLPSLGLATIEGSCQELARPEQELVFAAEEFSFGSDVVLAEVGEDFERRAIATVTAGEDGSVEYTLDSPGDELSANSTLYEFKGTGLLGEPRSALVGLGLHVDACSNQHPTPQVGGVVDGEEIVAGTTRRFSFECELQEQGQDCVSSHPDGALLDTSFPGTYEIAISTTATDGSINTEVVEYSVVADTTAPTIEPVTPREGAEFVVGDEVIITFDCEDSQSEVTACRSDADGSVLDTAALGDHELQIQAIDSAGNASLATVRYTVVEQPAEPSPEPTGPPPPTPTPEPAPDLQPTPAPSIAIERLDGAVLEAAITISQGRHGDGTAQFAVLARSDEFADALAGSSLTSGGPLLLTSSDQVHPAVLEELQRVLVDGGTVYLLGGPSALAPSMEDELENAGLAPQRLAGSNRVLTSLAVADQLAELYGAPATQYVARANPRPDDPTSAWADAIAVGPLLAATQTPVLLTWSDHLEPELRRRLEATHPHTALLGGEHAIPSGLLPHQQSMSRIAGDTRAETASVIATLWPSQIRGATLVNLNERDAWSRVLPAAGLAAETDSPILAADQSLHPSSADVISAVRCDAQSDLTVLALGDEEAVADDVLSRLVREDGC
ncbi:cell wall-binding repeat-containing protein [Euzebya tangerina]|uniref:cell wall-binding repeat-containing protein n=1 Tax=Euzebya tangerina TaxID=591198 RepID=UPI0013C2C800|nr:cell wall-binding repeat-containing protein [Euzebya tangerina]